MLYLYISISMYVCEILCNIFIEKGIVFIRHQTEWMIMLMWNENAEIKTKIRRMNRYF